MAWNPVTVNMGPCPSCCSGSGLGVCAVCAAGLPTRLFVTMTAADPSCGSGDFPVPNLVGHSLAIDYQFNAVLGANVWGTDQAVCGTAMGADPTGFPTGAYVYTWPFNGTKYAINALLYCFSGSNLTLGFEVIASDAGGTTFARNFVGSDIAQCLGKCLNLTNSYGTNTAADCAAAHFAWSGATLYQGCAMVVPFCTPFSVSIDP